MRSTSLGRKRVMVVDFEFITAGTQDIFYTDESVAISSIHRDRFYPSAARWDETCGGRASAPIANLP